jgi:hypothetical protein
MRTAKHRNGIPWDGSQHRHSLAYRQASYRSCEGQCPCPNQARFLTKRRGQQQETTDKASTRRGRYDRGRYRAGRFPPDFSASRNPSATTMSFFQPTAQRPVPHTVDPASISRTPRPLPCRSADPTPFGGDVMLGSKNHGRYVAHVLSDCDARLRVSWFKR